MSNSERSDLVDHSVFEPLGRKQFLPSDGLASRTQQPEATAPVVTLSVVMPNYNHANHLSTALNAIMAQQVLPDEIVIVDDGSTDNSRTVIEEWMSREKRIRAVFNPSNRGAIATINQGIEVARSEFVCLAAADDMVYPNFFREALAALERSPGAALFCAEAHVQSMDAPQREPELRPVIRPSHKFKRFSPVETRQLLDYNDHFIMSIATIFRRSVLLEEGCLDPAMGSMADGFLSRRLALKYGFCFTPKVVVRWQVWNDGLSRTRSRDPHAALLMLDKGKALIQSDPAFPRGYSQVFERRWRFAACRLALMSNPPDWDFVRAVGPGTSVDSIVAAVARKLGSMAGAYLALVWLTLRCRPYSLTALAGTSARRRWEALASRKMAGR